MQFYNCIDIRFFSPISHAHVDFLVYNPLIMKEITQTKRENLQAISNINLGKYCKDLQLSDADITA